MYLEKEIEKIGNELIKRASLEQTTSFSLLPPPCAEHANFFDLNKRIVYSIPERNFYEFKSIQHLFWEKFGTGASTYLKIQKIIISHEVGHALQSNLSEYREQLKEFQSLSTLAKIGSLDELYHHINAYQTLLVKVESEAWDLGWELIKEDVELELFDIVKNHALDSYKHGDFLHSEDEFHETYQFLLDGNQSNENKMDLIDFKTTKEGEIAEIKIKWDGEFIYAELLRKDDDYIWLNDKSKLYVKEMNDWEAFPVWENSELVSFAINEMKRNLKHIS